MKKPLLIVSAMILLAGQALASYDDMNVTWNPAPPLDGQTEKIEFFPPGNYQNPSSLLFFREGGAPCGAPEDCFGQFRSLPLGKDTSFSYAATIDLADKDFTFFIFTFDQTGNMALTDFAGVDFPSAQTTGIWTSAEELANFPMSGDAWDNVFAAAQRNTDNPDLSNQDDPINVHVLAKAIVYARTGDTDYRDEVIVACAAAMGTENGGRTLALGRELMAYVIAADLVGLPTSLEADFRPWLRSCLNKNLSGRTLVSTHEDRPNNWGTHAGASRIAVAAYLGDQQELDRAADVFRGWLGDRNAYKDFEYGELCWQSDPQNPVGINPLGAKINGNDVDGVLPDDQRRQSGCYSWPPSKENYVWEGLQGAMAQAVILSRNGYPDVWDWSDQALLRAVTWLHDVNNYPAKGDDTWQPHLVNHYYGEDFPAPTPSSPGKNTGWTDFTHQ